MTDDEIMRRLLLERINFLVAERLNFLFIEGVRRLSREEKRNARNISAWSSYVGGVDQV